MAPKLRDLAKVPNFGMTSGLARSVFGTNTGRTRLVPVDLVQTSVDVCRDLVLLGECHFELATRLLGQGYVWHEFEAQGHYELTYQGRRATVRSREGFLRAELPGAPDDVLAAASVLLAAGAVETGPARPLRTPVEQRARELSLTTPYPYATCLIVVERAGDLAARVLEVAAASSTHPLDVLKHLHGV